MVPNCFQSVLFHCKARILTLYSNLSGNVMLKSQTSSQQEIEYQQLCVSQRTGPTAQFLAIFSYWCPPPHFKSLLGEQIGIQNNQSNNIPGRFDHRQAGTSAPALQQPISDFGGAVNERIVRLITLEDKDSLIIGSISCRRYQSLVNAQMREGWE